MIRASKQLAFDRRGKSRAVLAELRSLSTMQMVVTSLLRSQGGYFGNVDRRGFMD